MQGVYIVYGFTSCVLFTSLLHTFAIAKQYTLFKKSFSLTLLMQNLWPRLQSQLSEACLPQCKVKTEIVIISITRSRIHQAYDIVAGIYRTISCTNARLARALLTYHSGGICVWLMSLAVHTVRGCLCLTFPVVNLSCSGDWGAAVAPVVG